MEALFGIIFGIGGPVLVIYLLLFYSNRKTTKKLDTLVKIVELGGTVDPKMMEMLNEPSGPIVDLRRGLIFLAIGIPLTLAIAANEGGGEWVYGPITGLLGVT